MTTTNIGPCQCCGQAEGCPCSTYAVCYFTWNGTSWDPLATPNPCNGTDEQDRERAPCCQCPGPPETPGTAIGEVGTSPCTQKYPHQSMCDCYSCTGTWSEFLSSWIPGPCLGPDGQNDASFTCGCPTAQLSPGDYEGQEVIIFCDCTP